jgi:hypothetical protein
MLHQISGHTESCCLKTTDVAAYQRQLLLCFKLLEGRLADTSFSDMGRIYYESGYQYPLIALPSQRDASDATSLYHRHH